MDPCTVSLTALLGWSLAALVAFVVALFFLDADLTLAFCEKFFSGRLSKVCFPPFFWKKVSLWHLNLKAIFAARWCG